MLIQLTGLSGAGKTTISNEVKKNLESKGFVVEILDGEAYRQTINKDLGFSKEDRFRNIRRLGELGYSFVQQNKIAIISAINPYEEIRKELAQKYGAKTVWIYCPLTVIIQRDTKGLYKRALLPDNNPDKIFNLTGINDVFEEPENADLIIDTEKNSIRKASGKLVRFITRSLK
jgi:adenylylsulfate kinase